MREAKPSAYYAYEREEMVSYIPKEATRILDVGCGNGAFGRLLKSKRTVEVWGIELVAEVAVVAQTNLDAVVVGNIEAEDIDLPLNYFDCVVFNDVIEHLVDPWSVLRRIKKHMVDPGVVVASIPNVRHWSNIKALLVSKKWDYEDAGILDRTHLRFFTIKSIGELFSQCGYEVVTIQGINGCAFSWKFGVINLLVARNLDDTRFTQFACVAKARTT